MSYETKKSTRKWGQETIDHVKRKEKKKKERTWNSGQRARKVERRRWEKVRGYLDKSLQRGRWKSWMKRVSGGHSSKTTFSPVFFPWFSSQFGRKKFVGPGDKFFSRVFHPLYFPLYAKQWKTHFSTPFFLIYFPPFLKSIQPNTLLGFCRKTNWWWDVICSSGVRKVVHFWFISLSFY